MPKAIPMVITNNNILIKDKETNEFRVFKMQGIETVPNIPFYHMFASDISKCQHQLKEFVKIIYGSKLSKYIMAIIVPDDTTPLESIFINEFFLNSGACKAVAQMNMGQALSKEHSKYISVSKSNRNVILQYINNNQIKAQKFYDINEYNADLIIEDAKRLHIDVEYSSAPVFVNNLNMNMDDLFDLGRVVTPKQFLDKIAQIDVEKV